MSASSSRSGRTGSTEYRARHAAVWPEMLEALAATRLAQLLAVPARRRPAHRLLRDALARGRRRGHGPHRRERPLAGGDGRVLRGARRRPARHRVPRSSTRSSTSRTSSPASHAASTTTEMSEHDDVRRHHRAPGGAGHRGPVVGLRQLRHPLQGVRQRRAPRGPSRRRSPTPPRCTGSPGSSPSVALHIPWDLVDDFGALQGVRRGPGRRARHDQLQHVPGRRLQARQPDPRRPEGPRRRRSTTTSTASR